MIEYIIIIIIIITITIIIIIIIIIRCDNGDICAHLRGRGLCGVRRRTSLGGTRPWITAPPPT